VLLRVHAQGSADRRQGERMEGRGRRQLALKHGGGGRGRISQEFMGIGKSEYYLLSGASMASVRG
jgi:hypothetical protein